MTTTQQSENNNNNENKPRDEDLGIMIYGNVKIRVIDTGKILVNQRA
jgi:hypothetical protein